MYQVLKKILFTLDAEDAHNVVMGLAHKVPLIAGLIGRDNGDLNKYKISLGRNDWTFPIGLAAGLDKNGMCIPFFNQLGFGAVEVGTVTPLAQSGNPRPRLHRITSDHSLRNSMGFNNAGSDQLKTSLTRIANQCGIVGVNIGKNKSTTDFDAANDYRYLYQKFKNLCDYIVINVSSPNTPGLRSHQSKDELSKIISILEYQNECDLFVKISPDIDITSLEGIIEVVQKFKLTGIIATNTTINDNYGPGGISGDLLYEKSHLIRQRCLEILNHEKTIELIGVGGFSNFEQMKKFWINGGGALQIYSSFIYQGPAILSSIQGKLDEEFLKFNVANFNDYRKIIKSCKYD